MKENKRAMEGGCIKGGFDNVAILWIHLEKDKRKIFYIPLMLVLCSWRK